MEDVVGKLKEKISMSLSDNTEGRFETMKAFNKAVGEVSEESEKKHFTDYLVDKNDLKEILSLIKNKRLSNNSIRNKIKEYLKEPSELNDFFRAILDSNKKKKDKKEENKEATGSAGAGQFSAPLFSTTKGDIVKGVKTVREQSESAIDSNVVKSETKEATSSSSSGQYNQPAIWAKSLKKKDWKGASTKYMPGAKRVQIKKKCKTFPYCNQGDISNLKIFENENVKKAVDSVSSKYGVDKDFIFSIMSKQIGKTIK